MRVEKIPWRRAWQPTPVFLPGKFHGQRSLAGYSPWDCKELDVTECTHVYTHTHTHTHTHTPTRDNSALVSILLIKYKLLLELTLILRLISNH